MFDQKVVTFNVGGRKYDVSSSLLSQYPKSMLAIKALKLNQYDYQKTIYIERDGERFGYCLDYLRDQKCNLPLTISRDSLLADLRYYGIEVKDKKTIKYTVVDLEPRIVAESSNSFGMIKDLNEQIESKRRDVKVQILTLLLLKEYMTGTERDGKYKFQLTKEMKHQVDEILVNPGEKIDVNGIKNSLSTYGLKIEKSSSSKRCLIISRQRSSQRAL